jgi:hypothetical protein
VGAVAVRGGRGDARRHPARARCHRRQPRAREPTCGCRRAARSATRASSTTSFATSPTRSLPAVPPGA